MAVLAELITSVREIRSPLVVGYSFLLTAWLFLRDEVSRATARSSLAMDIREAIQSLGGPAELALITFMAAMVGSLAWNVAVERLVTGVKRAFNHPDWSAWIDQARHAVKAYEEYSVTTQKRSSAFDASHNVPSPMWGAFLQAEVDERVRKASEVEFRITLAISLIPVALALSIEGGGLWWLSWLAPGVIWLDVTILKHTTAALLIDYAIRDRTQKVEQLRSSLERRENTQRDAAKTSTPKVDSANDRFIQNLRKDLTALERELVELRSQQEHLSAKTFGWVKGPTPPLP